MCSATKSRQKLLKAQENLPLLFSHGLAWKVGSLARLGFEGSAAPQQNSQTVSAWSGSGQILDGGHDNAHGRSKILHVEISF